MTRVPAAAVLALALVGGRRGQAELAGGGQPTGNRRPRSTAWCGPHDATGDEFHRKLGIVPTMELAMALQCTMEFSCDWAVSAPALRVA
mmetsp:Transcript_48963/g.123494  ORF Transcript_48963/g.123494 Transcript_48963/m.123494 type:complete len:89 (-) Transcript_48963:122-388(-)